MLEPLGTLITTVSLGIRRQPRPKLPKCLRLRSGSQSLIILKDLQSDIGKLISDLITGQVSPGAILEGINLLEYL
jgi:hypothetical protein